MRKKQGYQIQPAPNLRSYYMGPGRQPLAPDPYVLIIIITFLENKSMLLVLLVYCLYEYSCFEINSTTEKFNSVSPTLFRSLTFCYKQEPLMKKSQLWDGKAFINKIISCSIDPQLILDQIKPQNKFLNLVLLSVTFFIQFCFYELPLEQLFTSAQNSQNRENSYSEKLKPNSPVTSTNVISQPQTLFQFQF